MTQRRELTVAVALCLLGAAVLLLTAQMDWVSYFVANGRTAMKTHVPGAAAPLARALGLASLAGVVGIAAARGRGRVAVGVVLLLVGVGAAIVGARAGLEAIPSAEQVGTMRGVEPDSTAWPWVAAGAGLIVAVAGLLVAWRGPAWSALSQRYAGAAAAPAPAATEVGLWDAQSRGDDPTA